jgi:hypothetical protein
VVVVLLLLLDGRVLVLLWGNALAGQVQMLSRDLGKGFERGQSLVRGRKGQVHGVGGLHGARCRLGERGQVGQLVDLQQGALPVAQRKGGAFLDEVVREAIYTALGELSSASVTERGGKRKCGGLHRLLLLTFSPHDLHVCWYRLLASSSLGPRSKNSRISWFGRLPMFELPRRVVGLALQKFCQSGEWWGIANSRAWVVTLAGAAPLPRHARLPLAPALAFTPPRSHPEGSPDASLPSRT